MFNANMIAPCGLDCNICSQALLDDNPCQGCNGPDEKKPEFCAKYRFPTEKTSGYVINSDNLENVSVSVNNREDSATITLSTSYDSVYIYEVNSTTIGAKVDKDKNGSFETDLEMIGDTDGDKHLEITDATFIERHIAKLETPFSQVELLRGDVDMSGELEIIDVTAIQYALANMSTPYKPGVYCDLV